MFLPFHYTLKTTEGEIVEQDRSNWYISEFLADQIFYCGRDPEVFTEVTFTDTRDGNSHTYTKNDEKWKTILKELIDELEFRAGASPGLEDEYMNGATLARIELEKLA